MNKKKRSRWSKPAIAGVLCAAGAAGLLFTRTPRPPESAPRPADQRILRPPGPVDQPRFEVSGDGRPLRVLHRNAEGLSPLETMRTPEGTVTIQRTFSLTGELLKEEARLNGRVVPVPERQ